MFGLFNKGEKIRLYHQPLISLIHRFLLISVETSRVYQAQRKDLEFRGKPTYFKLQLCS